MDSITITAMESVNAQRVRWTLKKNDGLAHRPCSSGSPDLSQADTRPGYCDGVTNIPAYLNDDQTCTGYLKCDEFGGQFQCDCPAGLMWNKDWFYDILSISHKIWLIQSLKKWPYRTDKRELAVGQVKTKVRAATITVLQKDLVRQIDDS